MTKLKGQFKYKTVGPSQSKAVGQFKNKAAGAIRKKAAPQMPASKRWLALRKELLRKFKKQVQTLEGEEGSELKKYRQEYQRSIGQKWTVSSKVELLEALENVQIAYAGDFHSLMQSQRAHLRVLRSLPADKKVILGLESFTTDDSQALNAFLHGHLTPSELREQTDWDLHWGFSWEGTYALLELVKIRSWKVMALSPPIASKKESRQTLKSRDLYAAKIMAAAAESSSESLIYTIFGELHIGSQHLPKLTEECGFRGKAVQLHLNSEKIYFALAERGLDTSVDVVKLGRNKFCLIATPPWVQWQAHSLYLQKIFDDENFRLAKRVSVEYFDYTDHILELAQVLVADLDLQKLLSQADPDWKYFSVYTLENDAIWEQLAKNLNQREQLLATQYLRDGQSFYLPKIKSIYLASSSLNHGSEMAGQYLHAVLSRRQDPLWRMPECFYASIWKNAVGFFMSKMMNPQRRGKSLQEKQANFDDAGIGGKAIAIKIALHQRMRELGKNYSKKMPLISKTSGQPQSLKQQYTIAARLLGTMMGERLYEAFQQGKIKQVDLYQVLRFELEDKNFAKKIYPKIVTLLEENLDPSSLSSLRASLRALQERL